MKIVSLLASEYSGSTILSMALGSHPGILAFGDTYYNRNHPDHRCSCGARFLECEFRARMDREMEQLGFASFWERAVSVDGERSLVRRLCSQIKRVLPRRYELLNRCLSSLTISSGFKRAFSREQSAFFSVIAKQSGCDFYFDGCKSLFRAQLVHELFSPTKIVHLVRDPRGFIASSVKHYKERTGYAADSALIDSRLRSWVRYNSFAAGYELESGKDNYLRVYYGDLLSDPRRVVMRILSFIGAPDAGRDLTAFDLSRLHVSGNTTNQVSTRIEPRILGDWRKYADAIDFEAIVAKTRGLGFVQFETPSAEISGTPAESSTRAVDANNVPNQ